MKETGSHKQGPTKPMSSTAATSSRLRITANSPRSPCRLQNGANLSPAAPMEPPREASGARARQQRPLPARAADTRRHRPEPPVTGPAASAPRNGGPPRPGPPRGPRGPALRAAAGESRRAPLPGDEGAGEGGGVLKVTTPPLACSSPGAQESPRVPGGEACR
ncbi:atherin-like [Grus americana]|uniref:atherin-like n=1 Tax=Grus americana TaxID=9117 RepID=UPI0024079AB5|nr:atherin-like [Grus americana]